MLDSRSEEWIGGHGFLLFRVQFDSVFHAKHTPQGVVVEKTFYGMRMFFKTGTFGRGSAMLFSFVFTSLKEQGGIMVVSPSCFFKFYVCDAFACYWYLWSHSGYTRYYCFY